MCQAVLQVLEKQLYAGPALIQHLQVLPYAQTHTPICLPQMAAQISRYLTFYLVKSPKCAPSIHLCHRQASRKHHNVFLLLPLNSYLSICQSIYAESYKVVLLNPFFPQPCVPSLTTSAHAITQAPLSSVLEHLNEQFPLPSTSLNQSISKTSHLISHQVKSPYITHSALKVSTLSTSQCSVSFVNPDRVENKSSVYLYVEAAYGPLNF